MDKDKILKIGKSISVKSSIYDFIASQAEIKNFIGAVAGKNNSFYEAAKKIKR